jgi:hypothetical protein
MIGIVPAAGKAERFGGLLKELLPWNGGSLLGNTVTILQQHCDNVIVLTRPEKIMQHAQALDGYGATFILQEGDNLLSGLKSITWDSDYYLFAMPDTVFPLDAFPQGGVFDKDVFQIGLFDTTEGQKFGVWGEDEDGGWIDDKNSKNEGKERQAWGLLGWPRAAMNVIRETYLKEHTDAFNVAIAEVGFETFMMAYYHDFSSFDDYRKVLG